MPHDHVLVVDDERDILELVKYNLDKEGYRVTAVAWARTPSRRPAHDSRPGRARPDAAGRRRPRGLPPSQGRPETIAIPIVMLTAKGTEADVVTGLELGASDYVTKPFSPRVLTARVRAVLRRGAEAESDATTVRLGEIAIHPGKHRVTVGGSPVELTATEFRILLHLAAVRAGCSRGSNWWTRRRMTTRSRATGS